MENQVTSPNPETTPNIYSPSANESGLKSPKHKKIFLTIIGLAIFLLLIELGYFLYLRYIDNYAKPGPADLQERQIPSDAQLTEKSVNLPQVRKNIDIPKAQEFVRFLEEIQGKSEFLDNAVVNVILSGVVEESGAETIEEEGITYHYKLSLRSKEGNGHTFRFTQTEIDASTVFLITTQGTQSINFRDIIKEDTAVVDITTNLKDQTPRQLLIRVLRK